METIVVVAFVNIDLVCASVKETKMSISGRSQVGFSETRTWRILEKDIALKIGKVQIIPESSYQLD